jgi:multidrug efflux pump subunit AcrB
MTPTGRDDQPWRTLSPEVDRLQDVADAAQARFDDLAAVADAEGTVTDARRVELIQMQAQAWRRVRAARARLTRAQRVGDPAAIRAARQHLDATCVQVADTIDDCIAQLRQILEAGIDLTDDLLDQATTADTAYYGVTQALAEAQPGRLAGPNRCNGRSDNDGSPQ